MQKLFRFIIIATLTLLFSLGFHQPFRVNAQSSLPSQVSTNLIQDSKTHYDAGRFSDAVEILQQVVAQSKTTGDIAKQAQALSLASLAYQKLGRWEEANQAITESFAALDRVTQEREDPQFWQIYAQAWNAQGQLNLAKGSAEAAHESWQNAARFYAQAGDEIGKLGSQMNQTQALQSLGFYRRAEKELTELEQQILQLSDPMLKAIALHNLGNLRRKAGELNQAKLLLQQSLAIVQPLQRPRVESQLWLSLGNVEYTLSQRATELNNQTEAKQALQNALTHYQQAATIAPSSLTQVQAQLNQLHLFIDTKQYNTAQSIAKQVLPALESLPASRASIYASVNLAQSLIKMAQADVSLSQKAMQSSDKPALATSRQLLTNAIQQADRLDDQRAESYAAGALGQLAEQQQNWAEAQRYTQQALQLAQVTITPDLIYQWQWQMGRLLQAQTEDQSGDRQANHEAITYYTQALRVLNSLRSDLLALNPDVQFSFRERVEPIYRQLVDLLLRDEQPSKENLIQARNVIEALQLAELDNFFRDGCAQPEAINVDDLDPTAAVIYPILLDDRLEVILKLPGDENLRRVAHRSITAQQVDEAAEQLQQLLRRQSTSPGQIKKASAPLYEWLIRPFETELEAKATREQSPIKTLVFVLDGALRNIPPAVLFNGQQYLVERYAIAVTPGLQLLDPKPLPREALRVLAAGTTNAPSFQNEGFAPIDNVEIELAEVSKQVNHTQKLEDQDFLKETIQSKVKSNPFNVVHIATHGKFSSNPEQTFILDWNKRVTIKDLDVLLRTRETNETNPIELLILSACETASGDKRAALGLAGVAIRAGARSTLATLFQVNDASTAELMVRFYQLLKNPQLTKAEALRQAQLSFINGQDWVAGEENSTTRTMRTDTQLARPYFWSPFILVGNWL
jgi:CHAT domain-containing protein/tetratricopeptide (TPR) repeat protein